MSLAKVHVCGGPLVRSSKLRALDIHPKLIVLPLGIAHYLQIIVFLQCSSSTISVTVVFALWDHNLLQKVAKAEVWWSITKTYEIFRAAHLCLNRIKWRKNFNVNNGLWMEKCFGDVKGIFIGSKEVLHKTQ